MKQFILYSSSENAENPGHEGLFKVSWSWNREHWLWILDFFNEIEMNPH